MTIRVSFDELLTAAQIVWSDKLIAEQIALNSYSILNQVQNRKPTFYSGKKACTIIGGLFYLQGYRFKNFKKQNELASKLGTSDVSIRISYKKWLTEFPDLFGDVIGKFA